jgi:hypothetical protein
MVRSWGLVAGAAAAALGFLILASAVPAHAAGSFTDDGNGSVTLTYSSVNPDYGWIVCTGTTPASSCNITNLVGRIGFTQSTGLVPPAASPATIQLGSSYRSWISSSTTTLTAGSYTFAYWENSMASSVTSIANVSIGSSSNPSSSASGDAGPPAVFQQFATPAMGTCDAAQPEGLNWAGVASGGWSESWAQWANGGQGGTVCTRMLEYVNSWRIAN